MKPNNFRVGNFIRIGEDLKEINTVSVEGINHRWDPAGCWWDHPYEFPEEYNKISGIPLTADWFFKFGFIDETNGWYGAQGSGWCFTKKAENSKAFITVVQRDRFILLDRPFSKEIEFVHELQNIYFIVTGEELELVANGS